MKGFLYKEFLLFVQCFEAKRSDAALKEVVAVLRRYSCQMRAKDDDLQSQVFVCCFEIFFDDLKATMTKEVYRCEFSKDFVDDLENIEQKILVNKLLTQKKP